MCLAWAKLHGENREWVDKHKDLVTVGIFISCAYIYVRVHIYLSHHLSTYILLPSKSIAMIPSNIPGHFFADFGSELTCQGASHLIACLAKAKWPIDKETLVVWEDVVYDLLRRKDEYGQELAVKAIEAVMSQYGIDAEEIDVYPFLPKRYMCSVFSLYRLTNPMSLTRGAPTLSVLIHQRTPITGEVFRSRWVY